MNFIKQFHSGWAYLTILMGVILLVSSVFFFLTKRSPNKYLKKIGLFTTITFHIQLLIGLVYYILRFSSIDGSVNIMKSSVLRLSFIEHPIMMIAGVTFITIANAKIKRSKITKLSIVILSLLGLLSVLSRIPWNLWIG